MHLVTRVRAHMVGIFVVYLIFFLFNDVLIGDENKVAPVSVYFSLYPKRLVLDILS